MASKTRWRRNKDGGESKMAKKTRLTIKTLEKNEMGEKTRKQENVGGYKMVKLKIAPHRINNLWKIKVKSLN